MCAKVGIVSVYSVSWSPCTFLHKALLINLIQSPVYGQSKRQASVSLFLQHSATYSVSGLIDFCALVLNNAFGLSMKILPTNPAHVGFVHNSSPLPGLMKKFDYLIER